MVAVEGEHVDRREAVYGERGEAGIADEAACRQVAKHQHDTQKLVSEDADRDDVDADQLAEPDEQPGKERWRLVAVAQRELLREQSLLGIVDAERWPHHQPHDEVRREIDYYRGNDEARIRPERTGFRSR